MQLIHMEYCRKRSSWSGDCRYSPCDTGCSSFRISHGCTALSLPMKSVMSTTRSRTTGKLASGSTRMASVVYSLQKVAHVSLGVPFTFIPHEPHTPMRQDHRKVTDPSTCSLM